MLAIFRELSRELESFDKKNSLENALKHDIDLLYSVSDAVEVKVAF